MTVEKDKQKLEKAETWDTKHPIVKGPVKNPRVVISVALKRAHFSVIAQAAERSGVPISAFIREAALLRALERTHG